MWNKIKKLFGKKEDILKKNQNRRVLVVDDDPVERRFILRTLEKRGFQVWAEPSGDTGLRSAIKQQPDLMILDLNMPGLTGKEVCAKLKDHDETKDTPVIFLTGSAKPGDLIECFDLGAENFLSKPIGGGMLIRQVEQFFEDVDNGSLPQ